MTYGIARCYLPPAEVKIPPLPQLNQVPGTRFSDPGGMQGGVDLLFVFFCSGFPISFYFYLFSLFTCGFVFSFLVCKSTLFSFSFYFIFVISF